MTLEDFRQLKIGDIVGRKIKYVSERTGKVRTGMVLQVDIDRVFLVNYTNYAETVQCREIRDIL